MGVEDVWTVLFCMIKRLQVSSLEGFDGRKIEHVWGSAKIRCSAFAAFYRSFRHYTRFSTAFTRPQNVE